MLSRRDVLRLAAGSAAALAGCAGKSDGAVRVLTHPGQILPIFNHHAAHLETRGIKLKLLESPDPTSYLDAVKDRQTGGGRYDLVMIFPRFLGDLAQDYLRPLDGHLPPDLLEGVDDAYRTLYCRWGGKTVAVPVDGDVAMMYYRKDALENPEHQAKYKAKTGRELRVPRTWEDFRRVAEFFTGWEWGTSGRPGYGFQTWQVDDEPGAFAAVGLAGQFIYVHPTSRTVIVKLSYYPPVAPAHADTETLGYFKAIANAPF